MFSDFLRFFLREQKWLLLEQVSRTSAWSAAQTVSLPRLSRANVVFRRAIVVFRGLALWPPLFFPTQNGCQKSLIIVTLPHKVNSMLHVPRTRRFCSKFKKKRGRVDRPDRDRKDGRGQKGVETVSLRVVADGGTHRACRTTHCPQKEVKPSRIP